MEFREIQRRHAVCRHLIKLSPIYWRLSGELQFPQTAQRCQFYQNTAALSSPLSPHALNGETRGLGQSESFLKLNFLEFSLSRAEHQNPAPALAREKELDQDGIKSERARLENNLFSWPRARESRERTEVMITSY